jgi:hypothetical protein
VQYTRMTMGLKNAGCYFQRLVNDVHVELKGAIMQAYLDDLAVGSDTPKQHVVEVRKVLERTRDANLRLKLAKCKFGKTEVKLLGQKVRLGVVRPNNMHRDCLQPLKSRPTSRSYYDLLTCCSSLGHTLTTWPSWRHRFSPSWKERSGSNAKGNKR